MARPEEAVLADEGATLIALDTPVIDDPPVVDGELARDECGVQRRRKRHVFRSLGLWLSIVWLVLIVGAAILAPILPIDDPAVPDFEAISGGFSKAHWLGADSLGRDSLSRIIYGARTSLLVGVGAVALGILVGGAIGVIAGYFGGIIDRAATVLTDVILAFPGLLFLLTAVAIFGASVPTLIFGLFVLAAPTFIRLARANTLAVRDREYVVAARGYGSRPSRVLLREIVPNVLVPVAAFGFIKMGLYIVLEGSLSFLGMGVPPPTPSWGSMIAGGRVVLVEEPHVSMTPAAVMCITVLAMNYIGERIRKRYDVRASQL